MHRIADLTLSNLKLPVSCRCGKGSVAVRLSR